MDLIIKEFKNLDLADLYQILKLRQDIFIVEQNCPYHDIDKLDKISYHIYLKEAGEIIAYLRLYEEACDCHIGRVLAKYRRRGLGTYILKEAIRLAKRLDFKKVRLEAQTYAIEFYKNLGFIPRSNTFKLDGIDHVKMELAL